MPKDSSKHHMSDKPAPVPQPASQPQDKDEQIQALQSRVAELENALEQQTHRATQQLNDYALARSQFLSRISHELRTPINAITGMAYLLRDTPLTPQQTQCLRDIEEASQTLLGSVDDILDFSRLSSNDLTLSNDYFNLDLVMKSVANQMQPAAEAKGLDIHYHFAQAVPLSLRGDASRLKQVLIHLIDNAIKFTQSGHVRVNIGLQHPIDEDDNKVALQFEITDTGSGIEPAFQTRLFDAFSQQDESNKRQYPGTGLGLAICKQLIERMSGQIHIQSVPDKGTTVQFSIVTERGLQSPQRLKENPECFADLHTLIVDDNPIASYIVNELCGHLKLRTECVSNANDAIRRLIDQADTNAPFRLVLMDYRMPSINGLMASKLIKSSGKLPIKPKIVLTSAHNREEIFGLKHPDYVDGYIHKPITYSSLFDTIADTFGYELLSSPDAGGEPDYQRLAQTHILVVEDNPVNQKIADGLLTRKGARVTIANHGAEAIILLAQHTTFDAVLMDMDMPVMDGYEATQTIRRMAEYNHLPIIAMTAHVLEEDRERCLQAGMNDYLTKPVNPDLLYKTLLKFVPDEAAKEL